MSQQSRNFALNPKEGLKISAFKNAHTREAMADRELDKLARYSTSPMHPHFCY
jgi:ubiquitin-like domain-containing CTD phosphatase 1